MHLCVRAALAVAGAICLATPAAAADDPAPPPVQSVAPPQGAAPPATGESPAGPAASATPTPAAAESAPPAATPAAAASDQIVVAYVKHTKPPVLIDTTPAKASFALIGAAAMMAAGHDIVVKNDIQDPSGDMARDIATAYAAAHAGRVAETPISDDHVWTRPKSGKLVEQAGDARYVVDVDPPGLNLIYFSFDWTHFDLMFSSSVRVIDTSNSQIVAKAGCFINTKKSPGLLGHSELLADNAAALKQLIVRKSQACLVALKTGLKLGDGSSPAAAPSSGAP